MSISTNRQRGDTREATPLKAIQLMLAAHRAPTIFEGTLEFITYKYRLDSYGTTAFAAMPGEIDIPLSDSEHVVRYSTLTNRRGAVTAAITAWAPRRETDARAIAQIMIDPDRIDPAVVDRAVAEAERLARALDRDALGIWICNTDFRPAGSHATVRGIAVPRPGEDGLWTMRSGPLSDALARRDYHVGMTSWRSVKSQPSPIPVPAPVPDGFRVLSLDGPAVPVRLLDEVGRLKGIAAADVPMGAGPTAAPAQWDALRFADFENDMATDGMAWTMTAVQAPDGRLAGFTIQHWWETRPEAVYQGITVVDPTFRGIGLARVLKTHGLENLAHTNPQWQDVYTWNEVGNTRILNTNAAAGFRQVALAARWDAAL